MTSKKCIDNEDSDFVALPELETLQAEDEVYNKQISGVKAGQRNMYSTLSRQLVVSINEQVVNSSVPNENLPYTSAEVNMARNYLRRVSANWIPLEIAASRDWGLSNFNCMTDKPPLLFICQTIWDFQCNFPLVSRRSSRFYDGRPQESNNPFLWPALIGLKPNGKPDEDALLCAALLINELQIRWRGINVHKDAQFRSSKMIA
eukprot:IDg14981t1